MATKRAAKTTTIPTFQDITKQVDRLRKDVEKTVEKTVESVTREAKRYLPAKSRRQINDLIHTVTKTVDNVRTDVEDRVSDIRGTVDKRVKALRKDTTSRSQQALDTLEKETRKQVDRLLKALGVPLRGDIDGIKRRVGAIERKLDELLAGQKKAA